MGDFQVHRAKFFDFMPSGIQCIAHDNPNQYLAVGRIDSSIDLWKTGSNWYHQKTIPGSEQRNVNSLVWVKGRLFSAGLQGNITEYDLAKLSPKVSHFYGRGFWCMSSNHEQTRLALGCEDGCVRLYKILEKGVAYERAFDFQKGRIVSISWHESDEILVTGSIDNIRVWMVATGQVKQRISLHRVSHHKEVIVWCVAFLKDLTIVSGDSEGRTQFWDAKTGTLLQAISSHRASVLTLCVSKDEKMVCTAGIDPRIVQFSLASKSNLDSEGEWTKASVGTDHFHDVKALAIVGSTVVSGGTDTILRGTPLQRVATLSKQSFFQKRNDLPFPVRPAVCRAPKANLILCQHQNHLDVWRLGKALETENKDFEDGDSLPIETQPSKLIELKSKSGEEIVCSAISSCGEWLAYSTVEKIRLYKVSLEPLTIQKVPVLPNSILPAHQLIFLPDSIRLLTISNQRSVQLITLDDIHPTLLHTYPPMEHPISQALVSSKGTVAITADETGIIKVWNLKDPSKDIPTLLPRHKPILAMTLNKSASNLFVVYSDRTGVQVSKQTESQVVYHFSKEKQYPLKFAEFLMHQQVYSTWSQKKASLFCTNQWLNRKQSIIHAEYRPSNNDQVLLMDNTSFAILNKKKTPPGKGETLFMSAKMASKRNSQGVVKTVVPHGLAVCEKYRPLLFAGFQPDSGALLVIERPIKAIHEKLPPAFYEKKFGT